MSELQKAALNAVIAALLASHAAMDIIEASMAAPDDDETRDRDTEHPYRPRHRVQ